MCVRQDGKNLRVIPEEMRTEAVTEAAVSENGDAIRYLREDQMSEKLCRLAAESDVRSVKYMPAEMVDRITSVTAEKSSREQALVKLLQKAVRELEKDRTKKEVYAILGVTGKELKEFGV